MNPLNRTIGFIENKEVDRPPFHPILMRFAAKYAGVRYKDFCLSPQHKCDANLKCAKDFNSDWVNTMSDAYAEAEAFGTKIFYPEDGLPVVKQYPIQNIEDIDKIKLPVISDHPRLMARVKEIKLYREMVGDNYFICGWVEGPFAEYCDIRDLSLACMDLLENPEKVHKILDIITENAMGFITAQVKAGAHCIGIGDAACSLISPELYQEFSFHREKILVDHIHSLGAYAKLHICGNTSAILSDMIKTRADIVDIDHLVKSVKHESTLLSPKQVFSGNCDPVSIIQNGNEVTIKDSFKAFYEQSRRRCIISAGCEITPDTSIENLKSFYNALNGQ